MNNRAAKEKEYWNEAYRPDSRNHEKYLWTKSIAESSYNNEVFDGILKNLSRQKILVIGGGIDTLGVLLAQNNNRVVSADISHVAALQTSALARKCGVGHNLSAVAMNCEEMSFGGKFDVIVCKRALHHMNLPKVLEAVHASLAEGGLFLAEEPVCLLEILRWVHEKIPFHPEAPRTEDEVEFTKRELAIIERKFREVQFYYLDCLTRESIAYFLSKAQAGRLLRHLGKFDFFLINHWVTPLRYLSTYAIIQAIK